MNNDNINPELQAEQLEDAKYLEELNHYVSALPAPSAEAVALYRAKLVLMEEIHNEVKAKYPNFMPEYDPSMDAELNQSLGKYQEHTFSISSRDMHAE